MKEFLEEIGNADRLGSFYQNLIISYIDPKKLYDKLSGLAINFHRDFAYALSRRYNEGNSGLIKKEYYRDVPNLKALGDIYVEKSSGFHNSPVKYFKNHIGKYLNEIASYIESQENNNIIP